MSLEIFSLGVGVGVCYGQACDQGRFKAPGKAGRADPESKLWGGKQGWGNQGRRGK